MPGSILLRQINPFVRFAAEGNLMPINQHRTVCAADCRLIYLCEGECTLKLHQLTPLRLTRHAALLLPAGWAYRFEPGSQPPRLFLVNFDYTQARAAHQQPYPLLPGDCVLPESEREYVISDCEALNRPLLVQDADALEPILAEMQREFREQRRFFEQQLAAHMVRAITLLLRQALWEDQRQPIAVERMIAFIQARYAAPLTNEQVAASVNYHPVHANRLMKIHTGKTIHQYLLSCREQHAIALLMDSSLSITDIALQTGFANASSFSRYLRESTGHSPSDFRHGR